MEKIGYFKGKAISGMTREELLDFAQWAGPKLWKLQQMEQKYSDQEIKEELAGFTR